MKESDMYETMVKKTFFNKIKIKWQLLWRIFTHDNFILFADKNSETSFMSTMPADKTTWHLRQVMKKFEEYTDGQELVNDASNIINGIN